MELLGDFTEVFKAWRDEYERKYQTTPSETARPSNPINPSHYKSLDPEPIVVVENWNLDYPKATALVYIARAGRKEGSTEAEDLGKAIWFLQRRIEQLEKS